ncbi:MAG: LysR family transcriptional regulator [Cellvibrionaceae bacterium]|nr:LysR family transcriptional regulator [Cellvibrionaceae bacterium]
MTLDDLNTFIAVYKHKNLSVVARHMQCSQPAVSQHIVRLEKELGVALFERQARGVQATHAGEILYEYVSSGLNQIRMGVHQVQQISAGEAGQLSISTGGTTIRHFMSDAVVNFRHRYPQVQLQLCSNNTHKACIEALRSAEVDLAFITIGEPIKGIEQRSCIEMPWVLVMTSEDPLSNNTMTVKQLGALSFVSLKESSTAQNQLQRQLVKQGVDYQTTTTVDDWDTAIQFVDMGLGYAITPLRHAQNLEKQYAIRYVQIVDLQAVCFGWATRRWKSLTAIATDFVALFESCQID